MLREATTGHEERVYLGSPETTKALASKGFADDSRGELEAELTRKRTALARGDAYAPSGTAGP